MTKAQIEKSNFKFEFCMDWEETELDVFSEKQNQLCELKPVQRNIVKEMRLQFPKDIHFQSNRLVNIFYRPL